MVSINYPMAGYSYVEEGNTRTLVWDKVGREARNFTKGKKLMKKLWQTTDKEWIKKEVEETRVEIVSLEAELELYKKENKRTVQQESVINEFVGAIEDCENHIKRITSKNHLGRVINEVKLVKCSMY